MERYFDVPISVKRTPAMKSVFALLDIIKEPVIVEFGMTRIPGNWDGDGYSTVLFSRYVQQKGGSFQSVDIDPRTIAACDKLFNDYDISSENVKLHTGDGIEFAENLEGKIDLAFLDAWDYEGGDEAKKESEEKHLEVVKILLEKNAPRMFLFDDIFDNKDFTGKGGLAIPYLKENGYDIVENSYMVLMAKSNRESEKQ